MLGGDAPRAAGYVGARGDPVAWLGAPPCITVGRKAEMCGEAYSGINLSNYPGLLREECGRRGVSSYAQEVASLAIFRKVELLGEDENVGTLTGASNLRSIVF